MSANIPSRKREHDSRDSLRIYTQQAFSRATGAQLSENNTVRLLKDAQENYPAWLDAIRSARHHVHFDSYIIHEDNAGREFADAFIAKAKEGVPVRIVYDWVGGLRVASHGFWNHLRQGGVEVRCYNPPRLDSPFGWLSRDHRKMLEVDGRIGFVSGLCVGSAWIGDAARNIDPWRDTGVEIQGDAVSEIGRAFAYVWSLLGSPLPEDEIDDTPSSHAGNMRVRVVATMPMTAGMRRVDELVAVLARKRLWLTDAYYAGVASYVQALTSAAKDGADIRLLVPGGTDIPLLRPLSRAGYRPLLEAGVRVFEWNGTMLHAKTAVADGKWARVGSSNLNPWSWFGNCELDVVVEDAEFAQQMEAMYEQDLSNSTEIVLSERNKVRAAGPRVRRATPAGGGGSMSRAAAGTLRIGSAVGAALSNSRVFEPVESRILTGASALLLGLAVLFWFFPKVLVYPVLVLFVWFSAALLYRAIKVRRMQTKKPDPGEIPKPPPFV